MQRDSTAGWAAIVPAVVLGLTSPHIGGAWASARTAPDPYGAPLDTLIGDGALLVAAALSGWLTLLSLAAWACRAARRPVPQVVLTLAPRTWRPVLVALAGAAVLVASPAGATSGDVSRTTTIRTNEAPSSLTSPSDAAIDGLPLPDRPGRDRPLAGRPDRGGPQAATRAPASRRAARPDTAARDAAMPRRTVGGGPGASSPRALTTYRVRAGDSLWSIAEDELRASGVRPTTRRTDRAWRAWYATNRDAIGSDPSALKIGLVLHEPRRDT